ncbi:hypothetical protein BpHYR1_035503 [Brachionus plicatilis]|uniref:Uncharacterized protein n=1 Tax=Brachionus plicatilis TaxID=10195 RepID=A0A3M7P5Z9_BRAPC|nr:hypothetical protein BpHYR1_035503 [Brachionus plicatilis]
MLIFKNVTNLKIHGLLDKIENDSFREIKAKYINLLIDNYLEIFSQGLEWMNFLNSNLTLNFSDANDITRSLDKAIFVSIIID